MRINQDVEVIKTEILSEWNPCGISEKLNTHCEYIDECNEFGTKENMFVCIPKTSFQLIKYIKDTNKYINCIRDTSVYIESLYKETIGSFIKKNIGKFLVNPKKDEWNPILIQNQDTEQLLQEVMIKSQEILSKLIDEYNKRIN